MQKKNASSLWLPILLLMVVVFAFLSPRTTATLPPQPIPPCSSLVQAAGVSCVINSGLLRKVFVSLPLQPTAPVVYVQDLSSGNLYRLLTSDATTAQIMSEIPDMSQVSVLGLLTIPSASTDLAFTGDIMVQGITTMTVVTLATSPVITIGGITTMTVVTLATSPVITIGQATYTIVATVPGGQTTMVGTVTGGTYTLTLFPPSSPSPACPVSQYRDQNVGICLPNLLKPVVAAFVKLWNQLRCLFGYC
jgi:hypothetical protein